MADLYGETEREPGSPEFSGGPLRIASRDSVATAMREEREAAEIDNDSEQIQGLAAYLHTIWDINSRFKREQGIQGAMESSLRARNAEYDPDKLAQIRSFGGSDVYMGLTGVKCRAAEAWLTDILSSTEKPWSLRPTPVPDISDEMAGQILAEAQGRVQRMVAEAAEGGEELDTGALVERVRRELTRQAEIELNRRTKLMEDKIHDQMVEGGWCEAFDAFISDLVTLKAGIIKGPIARIRRKKKWTTTDTGNAVTVEEVAVPEYERVSPFDLFPSPDAVGVNDGSLVERIKFSRRQLVFLKEQPGYDSDAIDEVLAECSYSPPSVIDQDLEQGREDAEERDPDKEEGFSENIEGREFWCSVQGKMLKEYGVEQDADEEDLEDLVEYQINAIMVGERIIYLDFNDDPLGERPYFKAGWGILPGSFWYQGVPELMSDLQTVCNASARALVNNMAHASGPQAEVDVGRLLPGEDIESMYPLKIWQTTNKGNNASPAVRFFQPDSNAGTLMDVYSRFAQLADDYTGIPAYAYGNDQVAGAGRTSSGLSMLMSSAARGIKRVLMSVEKNVIRGVIRRQYDWNRQYLGDEFTGDVDVIPTGVVAIMIREQMSDRRMQFLQTTANEHDMKIVGLEHRAAVLRETAQTLEIPGKELTRSDEELRTIMDDEERRAAMEAQERSALVQAQTQEAQAKIMAAQADAQNKQAAAQARLAEIEMNRQKFELEAAKLQLEMQKLQADIALRGQEVNIKGQRAAAQDEKDRAVALDLGARSLQTLAQPQDPMEAAIAESEGIGGV